MDAREQSLRMLYEETAECFNNFVLLDYSLA